MKTKISAIVLSIALLMPVLAFAQKKEIKGVVSIEVNIACQLILVQGNSPNLEIVGDQNTLEDIETIIKNETLIITSDRLRQHKEDVIVKIEVADLRYLSIAGAVDLKTMHALKLDELELSVSGVGNLEMALETKSFKLSGSGVTNLDISGTANEMSIEISGVGNIRATNFVTKNANVNNSGVGKANVNVTGKLVADVSGIGSIYYSGNPLVNASVSGLGRIGRF